MEEYKGWLTSNSLMKRSFAVMGHLFMAYVIFVLVIMAIAIVFGIIGSVFI